LHPEMLHQSWNKKVPLLPALTAEKAGIKSSWIVLVATVLPAQVAKLIFVRNVGMRLW